MYAKFLKNLPLVAGLVSLLSVSLVSPASACVNCCADDVAAAVVDYSGADTGNITATSIVSPFNGYRLVINAPRTTQGIAGFNFPRLCPKTAESSIIGLTRTGFKQIVFEFVNNTNNAAFNINSVILTTIQTDDGFYHFNANGAVGPNLGGNRYQFRVLPSGGTGFSLPVLSTSSINKVNFRFTGGTNSVCSDLSVGNFRIAYTGGFNKPPSSLQAPTPADPVTNDVPPDPVCIVFLD